LNIDLANFIKNDINSYAEKKHGIKLTVKYLDPKRSIRASPPNAEDTQISHTLALSAAHSGMAGFTDFAVGLVRCQCVMIPFDALEQCETRMLKRKDNDWQRLLMSTGQSDLLSAENQGKYKVKEREEQLRRKEKYLNLKVKLALGTDEKIRESEADHLNY
jgi:hypothetical protein